MEWIGQNEGRNQVKYPACRDSLLLSLGILATHTHKYLHNITVAITHTLRPPSLSIPILKSSQSLSLLPVLAHFLSTSIPLTLPPSLVFAYPPFPPLYGHSFSLPHFSFLSFSLTHPLPPLSLFLSYPYLFPYSSLTLSLPLSLLPSLSLFLSYPYFSLTYHLPCLRVFYPCPHKTSSDLQTIYLQWHSPPLYLYPHTLG